MGVLNSPTSSEKYFWPVLGVCLVLIASSVAVLLLYRGDAVWDRIACEGLEVFTDNFAGTMGAKFFPAEKRLMIWDDTVHDGRNVRINDFSKLAGKLPAHVLIAGEGYTYGMIVESTTPSFRIPHFSYANITVVSAVESFSGTGGDFNLYLPRVLTDMTVNFTAEDDEWVKNPGLIVYTDGTRTVEAANYTWTGDLHNTSVEISASLALGMNFVSVQGNCTDFSWRFDGNSSFNLKTSLSTTAVTTKTGYCILKCWVNATTNYTALNLAMALPLNGTHSNGLLSCMEGLSNITLSSAKCWLNGGIVVINGTGLDYGYTRLYVVKSSWRNNTAPKITSTPDKTTAVGVAWSYQITATDPDPGDFTYYLPVHPSDMEINHTTGLVRWNPDFQGSYHVTVSVSDGLTNTTQTFTLVVDDSNWARIREGFWNYLMTPAAILVIILYVGKWMFWDKLKDSKTVKEFTEDSKKV